jgi:hypothetical protein
MSSQRSKKIIALTVTSVSAVIILVAVIVIIILLVKKRKTSDQPPQSSSSSDVVSISSSDVGIMMTGNMWLAEPVTGPYPYNFAPNLQYRIGFGINPTTNGVAICIAHPAVLGGIMIGIRNGFFFHSRDSASSNTTITSSIPVEFGAHYRVYASFDGTNVRLSVNNTENVVSANGDLPENQYLPLIIGCAMGNSTTATENFCSGLYSRVKIWDDWQGNGNLLAYYDFTTTTSNPTVGTTYTNLGNNGSSNVLTLHQSNTYLE